MTARASLRLALVLAAGWLAPPPAHAIQAASPPGERPVPRVPHSLPPATPTSPTPVDPSASPAPADEAPSRMVVVPPPRWTIQVDPLTVALGFAHVQVERALGDHVSVYLGPSVRLFDPLEKSSDRYIGVGGELGVRVFPWGEAPRGAWGQVRGVLARLHTDRDGGADATGGYASVLGGYTWIFRRRWVVAAGLGVQYLHYRVAGLGSVGFLPAAHTTVGVAF